MADATQTAIGVVTLSLPAATAETLRSRANDAGISLEAFLEELAEREAHANDPPDPLAEAVKRLTSRTAEQVSADRERILAATPLPRPLPEGKTLFDVVVGTWPGDETDDEIRDKLDKLS